MSSQVESDLLADAAGFGYLFEMLVACTVRGHGKYEIASGKSLVPFYQLNGYRQKFDDIGGLVFTLLPISHTPPSESVYTFL